VFASAEPDFGFEHPVNSFDIVIGGEKIGFISVPHPTVLANIDKKCAVVFFEINTAKFASVEAKTNKYSEPSKFPAIDIDMTFVCDPSAVVFGEVVKAASEASSGLLADVKSRGVYVDEAGVSALTLRFSFVSKEKTLSKQELAPTTAAVAEALCACGLALKA
jgi:phenylalanyl-tRNA synthetase beta chain